MEATPQATALKPLAPVHLAARRSGAGVTVTWIRRKRGLMPASWDVDGAARRGERGLRARHPLRRVGGAHAASANAHGALCGGGRDRRFRQRAGEPRRPAVSAVGDGRPRLCGRSNARSSEVCAAERIRSRCAAESRRRSRSTNKTEQRSNRPCSSHPIFRFPIST